MEPDEKNEEQSESLNTSRRKLLGWMVGIINVAVGAAVVLPTIGFVAAPIADKKKAGTWIPVLKEEELGDGETKSVTYQIELQDAYMKTQREYSVFVHRQGAQVIGFDASCPHLGCHVEFKDSKNRYVCPCHGAVFDAEGIHLSGPAPRGLYPIRAKVEQGQIWIFRV
jgi:Rieske Fe-S protein